MIIFAGDELLANPMYEEDLDIDVADASDDDGSGGDCNETAQIP